MSAHPVLWHLEISHYNEKVRWALDYKAIVHERRVLVPGLHVPLALALTRGRHYTSPVLELDGRRVGDSTAIIRALEERHPTPPLYPTDAAERRRALELEDVFDEELGPYIRRLVFHELLGQRAREGSIAARLAPAPLQRFPRLAENVFALIGLRFGALSAQAAEKAHHKVLVALDRLEAELGTEEYLVGGRFTVADLTAASLFYPLVLPAEGPVRDELPTILARFREPLQERPGFRWVEEMFRRHRHGRTHEATHPLTPGGTA